MIIFINYIFVLGSKEMVFEFLSLFYIGIDKNCDNNLYVELYLYMENVVIKILCEEN